jgi:hypothetical protein
MHKFSFTKGYILWPFTFVILLMLSTVGVIAFPNPPSPPEAFKITPVNPGEDLPDGFYLYQGLSQHGVEIESITPANNSLVVKLHLQGQQHLAQETLKALLPGGYNIQPYLPEVPHQWADKMTHNAARMG